MFRRILIANRGEVAARIARGCDSMGIAPVFAVSSADSVAPHLTDREKIVIGPARSDQSYLDSCRLVEAARQTKCSALHPGWGFLSENALFAALCEQHGITFIGPSAAVMHKLGDKLNAKAAAGAAGLPLIPGSNGSIHTVEQAKAVAKEISYPLIIKAESGGGGRGMRVVATEDKLSGAFAEAQAEALACFGSSAVYIEKLLEGCRHIELQVIADRFGRVIVLGARDCTIQRNHQKLIEEAPANALPAGVLEDMTPKVAALFRSVGYVGAGTVEFLLDGQHLRFMEVNTRLQVEHPVTEMCTNFDLVMAQIEVAAGRRLPDDDVPFRGHSIECRINAEDASDGFTPSPGRIDVWEMPQGDHVRVDTHIQAGYVVPPHYDSLLCKVIVWGEDRIIATKRMLTALEDFRCEGVKTTLDMHKQILRSEQFVQDDYSTRAIPGWSK